MGIPEYERVINEVRQRIMSGEWRPGQRIPKIRELAKEFATGQTTVKTALMFLRAEGLVRGQQGKAIYVADPLPAHRP